MDASNGYLSYNYTNMKRKFILLCILLLSTFVYTNAQYLRDSWNEGYLYRTIEQPEDYSGKVVCTIIKKETLPNIKKAIVYVHGYNDYFFQSALGDSANAHGYNFYAVDLRKYGRSLLPNQDAFFCKKMEEYFADIDTTIAIARAEGNEEIILMGHSTGGLSTSLYVHEKKQREKVDALVLNSPFLDWNLGKAAEGLAIPVMSFLGGIFPKMKVQGTSQEASGYAQSLLKKYNGEWYYNDDWKMSFGHKKRAGWVHAIQRGQRKVHKGLNIDCPILVMSSDNSVEENAEWKEEYKHSDVVLDVKEIHKYGDQLGGNVTHIYIKGGLHDLILSEKPARDETYKVIFEWLKANGE